jgi:phosphatidylglycerol:prolipoprotein diacylglycerol transferase
MVPYIHIKDLSLGFLTLHPFGVLVAMGVVIGTWLATWRARKRGMDLVKLNSFVTWMLVAGFIGGHVLDSIFYHPKQVMKDPLSLIRLWEGLSSFGGFVGGAIGILLWKYFEIVPKEQVKEAVETKEVTTIEAKSEDVGYREAGGEPVTKTETKTTTERTVRKNWFPIRRRAQAETTMPFMDLILSVFPVAWIFGRSGCSVVHDHPGALADKSSFLSVAYPGIGDRPQWEHFIDLYQGTGYRYDLGLMELSFTIVLAAILATTWRKRLPAGTYIVAVCLTYAPVRFAMDRLRITEGESADPRYFGFTPAQWACIALFAAGLGVFYWVFSMKKRGIDLTDRVLAQ